MQSESRNCQNCKTEFRIEPEDFAFYEKIKVPPPTWCPSCRFQRRLSFMNERVLYKRTCDMCKKNMIAMYPADSPLTVYCNSCWWSDKWDPLTYGREYDPHRSFFEQLKDLIHAAPQPALWTDYPSLINSDYVNHTATAKNCYLIFTADYCENVLYSSILLRNKDMMDSLIMAESELCYFDIGCGSSYMTHFSEDCRGCRNVYFSKECVNCSNCFGCINLKNKNYYIFNQPYTREEYEKKVVEFAIHTWDGLQKAREKALTFWRTQPHKYMHDRHNERATGDYVYFSKNISSGFIVRTAEDSKYCQMITLPPVKDCHDLTLWGNGAEQVYEGMIVGAGANLVKFSLTCWSHVMNVEYCFWTMTSSYMFGCANIRQKEYCILNKQYTKEEFHRLRERIIADMNERPYADKRGRAYRYGEFLPSDLSLAAYNESYAMDFFPLTEQEARERGYEWKELPVPSQAPTLRGDAIPGNIFETPDSITKEVLQCIECGKPFLIVPAELALLRRFGFPVPRRCFNCRYRERISRLNPPRLWSRNCTCGGLTSDNGVYRNATNHPSHSTDQHCPNEFETSFAPDRREIVYCEACYNAEVV